METEGAGTNACLVGFPARLGTNRWIILRIKVGESLVNPGWTVLHPAPVWKHQAGK